MTDPALTPALSVTIVSVAYNSTGVIGGMLDSIPQGVPVVVVDNASSDAQALRAICAGHGARLIESPRNIGFGPACNLGAAGAETEFLLFLNPDARLTAGALAELVAAAARHPRASGFNPALANSDGKVQFKRRSVLLPKSDWLPREVPAGEIEMPVLSGAAMFLRRAAFETVGGFDPDLFMYHEDDDLSIRLRRTVGPLIHVPGARVEHAAGRSSVRTAEMAAFKGRLLGESRVLAMAKHGHRNAARDARRSALGQMLLPWNLISARKRAKQRAFLDGVASGAAILQARQPRQVSKLKREAVRLKGQILALPVTLKNRYGTTPYYDRVLSRLIRHYDGARPDSQRVAVVVIYPQQGLEASHIEMLRYFNDRGYACLVVSNLPLGAADRTRLLGACWHYIERPNFGYDFGAYRDGVMHLFPRLDGLERLVLINDSSWFPLPGARDWLEQAEALDVDYAGAISQNGVPKTELDNPAGPDWRLATGHRHFHYASYALAIRPAILRDPGFRRFWQKYRLTQVKNTVVRRGEIGLTRWVLDSGHSHGATYDVLSLAKDLAACGDSEIDRIARDLITLNQPETVAWLDAHVPALSAARSPAERAELERIIKTVAIRVGVSYVLPRLIYRAQGFAFLKKSPIWLSRRESDVVLDFARELPPPFGPVILDEARALRRTSGPRFDPELAREAGHDTLVAPSPGPELNWLGWPKPSAFRREAGGA
ncbi:glycosyltransferase [Pseudooceanicola sp. 216_PA32_1]|uniref:Glycosyltransferase n=1 Tax=Pseudooceanicola pacificus TaxID=2676438 RepID=A0A844W0R2_9RHOB|nr:rhamnan synthesis F family protein [Pseudooceanicola pacificus]MWB76411.1 glycosyltransferase [Pseudooceanicola pacificus]